MRKGRKDEARETLKRLSPGYWEERNVEAYLAVIQHTDELERAEAKQGSFKEMWKGANLRRTEIVSQEFY